ncbi:MAG: hypothetical protein JSW49_07615 [candidate division WOR-3 bacterium]|nr:MAG: hypothetical protein JSW49_07615 [candidate division WOR-3 bacterium]
MMKPSISRNQKIGRQIKRAAQDQEKHGRLTEVLASMTLRSVIGIHFKNV